MSVLARLGPHALRLREVRDRIREAGLDGLLVSHGPNIRWLSGFSGSSAFLWVQSGSTVLITDFRYRAQAAEEVPDEVTVRITSTDLFDELSNCLRSWGSVRRAGFEDANLSVRDRRALGEACGGVMWEPAGAVVDELRVAKDDGEVAAIRAAVRVAEEALAGFIGCVTEGVSERQLASELVFRLRSGGSDSLPFEPIVASGPRSALPHARPGERTLREGDLLLVDFGASVGGYCSDMTRVFSLGPPAPWQREVHALVTRAVEEAIAATQGGVAARDVDRAARDVIDGAGFGERFGHGTGHGVGLEVHERPSVNARSSELLPEGSVVTIEPAVYLPGRGGVRLEEMVLVVDGGRTVLTSFPLELREI